MKTFLIAALFLSVAAPASAGCITTHVGRTICRDAAGNVVATPPAPAVVPVAPVAPAAGAVVVAPGAAVVGPAAPVVIPHAVVGVPANASAVTTVQGPAGGRAAYNPRTGNAAVSTTNAYGVRTTQTARGGEAKTRNGMGIAQGPGGKTCVKGRRQAGCN